MRLASSRPRAASAPLLASGQPQNVTLKKSLPVLLTYWTAWVDDAGALQLGRDVYGRDAGVAELLGGGGPAR